MVRFFAWDLLWFAPQQRFDAKKTIIGGGELVGLTLDVKLDIKQRNGLYTFLFELLGSAKDADLPILKSQSGTIISLMEEYATDSSLIPCSFGEKSAKKFQKRKVEIAQSII